MTACELTPQPKSFGASPSLGACAGDPSMVKRRLDELDREWDTDRVLETEAAGMGLVGLALGVLVRPGLLALPAFVAASVLVHAATGRYPLMPIFRRLGVRTSREIARERYALKALRGDFADMQAAQSDLQGDATDQPCVHPASTH